MSWDTPPRRLAGASFNDGNFSTCPFAGFLVTKPLEPATVLLMVGGARQSLVHHAAHHVAAGIGVAAFHIRRAAYGREERLRKRSVPEIRTGR